MREPDTVVQVNLRIRERLRLQLEAAANKRGVSLNYEMMDRLAQSFEQEALLALDEVARDMQRVWLLYADRILGPVFDEKAIIALATNPDPKVANLAQAYILWKKRQPVIG